ncbi:hypothetical protein [Streptomyces sp. NWU339]|uniref:hypothetical protein n=1 Tax=Streptomyces sp. NWU339 TaxID=2185284 RepID=UPI0015E80A93|nr:hypothetical protein [Streptomyces sp. NWU339]
MSDDGTTTNGSSLIDEIVREGAGRMLAAALEAEVNALGRAGAADRAVKKIPARGESGDDRPPPAGHRARPYRAASRG